MKQVSSRNKKGFFKALMSYLENYCKVNKINLLISQILNPMLTDTLEKNGFKILKDEYGLEINAVKVLMKMEKSLNQRKF